MMAGKTSIAKVHVTCNFCGADNGEPIGAGKDHEYEHTTSEVFSFVRCRSCSLVYLDPRPAVSELETIYPDDYYAYRLIAQRAGRKADSRLGAFMARRSAQRLVPYATRVRAIARDPYRILDVGCGDGTALAQWRTAFGVPVETHGVEMNEGAAAIARRAGHEVTTARIEDAQLADASFDLIYSFHVIEHVEDPSAFLAALRRAIRPSGYVLLDTPNVDTVDFRLLRERHWGAYHFPRHWTLFSPSTMKALAAKTGFDVLEVTFEPSAIFWVWTMHSLLVKQHKALADRLFPPVDIFTRATPWNVSLLAAFTLLDRAVIATTGRCAQMRILLRPVAR